MPTYYVSPSGNNANTGLGPTAALAWLTIAKALGAAGISSGDTVYIAPGVYRETVTVNMISAVAETRVLGDPLNAQGFRDAAGALLTPGIVRWTGYTTNDKTAPSANATFSINGRDYLTFEKIYFVASDAQIVSASVANATNLTFRDCTFIASSELAGQLFACTTVQDNSAFLFERCVFLCGTVYAIYLVPTGTGNLNIIVRNCLFLGPRDAACIYLFGGAVNGNGLLIEGNTFAWCLYAIRITATNAAQANPAIVRNNLLIGCLNGFFGNTAGTEAQWVEDYNLINATTPRTNVTAGANSISNGSYSCLFEAGYGLISGLLPRPFFEPIVGSPILGFGDGGAFTSVEDKWGRTRPSGGASLLKSVGCWERHDFGAKELTTVDASDASIALTGPGDHEVIVAVDPVPTTIGIRARYDANHGAGTPPQVILLAGPEIGVATQTRTMAAAVNTWETLTFATFTPTAKGWVRLRLLNRAAAGTGIAYFDTVTIT